MKTVFFGSDKFSIKALEACLHANAEIVLAVTSPARKQGRGLKLEPSELAVYCRAQNIPLAEYPSLKDQKVKEDLLALRPDVYVAASYGKLIPPALLAIPRYRLNVHPSLLPRYRGAAPVNWPILNGDTETGVSLIDIAEALDSGDIYCQEKLTIGPRMNAEELSAQLAALSYGLLKKTLEAIKSGALHGTPQDHSQATLARQLEKKDGEVSFDTPAEQIDRKVRGLVPWPGCFFFLKGERIALIDVEMVTNAAPRKPGTILSFDAEGGMTVSTPKDAIRIFRLKPESKKVMTAADFARGRRFGEGAEMLS